MDDKQHKLENMNNEQQILYKDLYDFCNEIGIPNIHQNIFMNYLQKVDNLIETKKGYKLLDNVKEEQEFITKDELQQTLLEALTSKTGVKKSSEILLFNAYQKTLIEYQNQKDRFQSIEAQAHTRTKLKLSTGLVALFGQMFVATYGTYVYYSWDIIEPIIYFMNLTVTIGLSLQFFRLKQEFDM